MKEDETILSLYKRIAAIVQTMPAGFSLDIEGPTVRLKCRAAKPTKFKKPARRAVAP